MKKKEIICPNCSYYFFPGEHHNKEKGNKIETKSGKKNADSFVCPFCKKNYLANEFTVVDDIPKSELYYESKKKIETMIEKGILTDVQEVPNTGYKTSLGEFKSIFEVKEKRVLISKFFNNDIAVYRVEFQKGKAKFFDSDNQEVSIEQVHEIIQNDIVMQRKIYGLWWTLFR